MIDYNVKIRERDAIIARLEAENKLLRTAKSMIERSEQMRGNAEKLAEVAAKEVDALRATVKRLTAARAQEPHAQRKPGE